MPWPVKPTMHYYGDQVRSLFITAAIIMAIFLPFYAHRIPEVGPESIIAILVLGVAAGLTSPKRAATALLDVLISLAAIVVFERAALAVQAAYGTSFFFLINEALAVIFLCALYFAVKTLRGMGNGN